MASVINPYTKAALEKGLKFRYGPVIPDIIRAEYPLLRMLKEDNAFKAEERGGGRKLIWELNLDRPMNIGVRAGETDSFPGFSGSTNDDIDRPSAQQAEQGIKFAYSDGAVTEHMMAEAHVPYDISGNFSGRKLKRQFDMCKDDLAMQTEWQLLGDGTAVLGVIVSLTVNGDGNTELTLSPASAVSDHGILGTQRLYKNQKISFIQAADWANDRYTAKIATNIGGVGTPVAKIVSVSGTMDTSAAPVVTIGGDWNDAAGDGALAAGDILVMALSRDQAAGGGTNGSADNIGAMDGAFNLIDDGTKRTLIYGLDRTDLTELKSTVSYSNVARAFNQELLQTVFNTLRRRRGSKDSDNMESEYFIFCERSIPTKALQGEGEAQKRYMQEAKALEATTGWKGISFAFLENDRPVPLKLLNTMPYGHALITRPKGWRVMWDIKPGFVDGGGSSDILRFVEGKPEYVFAMQQAGNIKIDEPWFDAVISGLEGSF